MKSYVPGTNPAVLPSAVVVSVSAIGVTRAW
jgi:hypothetical protein